MFPGAKVLLTLFVLAGFSSAVGIPLSFTSQSSSAQGGGASPQFKVTKCVDGASSNWAIVNFGDEEAKEVCWTRSDQSTTAQTSQNTNEEKFSDLFTNKWSSPNTSWSSSGAGQGNEWRTNCHNGSPYQFIIQASNTQQTNDPEYVGLCIQDNSGENQKYVSIKGKDHLNGNLTIKVCSGSSCWQSRDLNGDSQQTEGQSSNINQLSSTNESSWETVTFKKKN